MDLIIFWFSVVVLGFLSYIFIFHFKKTKSNVPKLPLGSFGLPIIGESLKFISPGGKSSPEIFVKERMTKYSPDVFRTCIVGEKVAVFCGIGGNKIVVSSDSSKIGSWFPAALLKIMTSKGSSIGEAKNLHNLTSQFLRPESLREYVPIMDGVVGKYMVDEWVTSNQVILASASVKKMAFSVACRLFMNIQESAQVAQLYTHFAHILAGFLAVPINIPGTTYNRAINGAKYIRRELFPIIKERRSQLLDTNTDMLTYLVGSIKEDDKMNLNEIADSILSVLVAGHDTISSVMAMILHLLSDHPHIYNQVLEEQMEIKMCKKRGELLNWEDTRKMKYSNNVIKEVMRLAPPVVGNFRQANSDITYAGFTIPKGWKIFWSVHSTNKDPKLFENPEVFDPSRFEGIGPIPYSFIPFGKGVNMCPGHEYARLELLVFMHNLVTRFRWEKLVQNEKIIYGPIAMLASGLPIKLLPLDHN